MRYTGEPYEPTAAEIAEHCKRFRATWSAKVRAARHLAPCAIPWSVPRADDSHLIEPGPGELEVPDA